MLVRSSALTASGTVARPIGVISRASSSVVMFSKPRSFTMRLHCSLSSSRQPHSIRRRGELLQALALAALHEPGVDALLERQLLVVVAGAGEGAHAASRRRPPRDVPGQRACDARVGARWRVAGAPLFSDEGAASASDDHDSSRLNFGFRRVRGLEGHPGLGARTASRARAFRGSRGVRWRPRRARRVARFVACSARWTLT